MKHQWRTIRVVGNRGFTFIEMIAALALMALLAAIFGMGLVSAVESYDFSRSNTDLAQKGQLAMARLSRELSALNHIVSEGSDSQSRYITYTRLDADPATGEPALSRFGIHFQRSTGKLLFYSDPSSDVLDDTTAGQGDLLAENVDDFALTFFKGTVPWLSNSDKLEALSTIQIELQLERPHYPGRTQRFSTLIRLHNTENTGGAAYVN